jgi:hypothetical protein
MDGEVPAAGIEQRRAVNAAVDRSTGPAKLRADAAVGMYVGMRLLVDSTTPPMACEPNRSVAGPRTTSTLSLVRGSTGTK